MESVIDVPPYSLTMRPQNSLALLLDLPRPCVQLHRNSHVEAESTLKAYMWAKFTSYVQEQTDFHIVLICHDDTERNSKERQGLYAQAAKL